MEKIVQQGLLYDFYGDLLTDHQKKIYEYAVYENLTLGEIADETGVSRQAVHDLLKRCDQILADYDSKLGLIAKYDAVRTRAGQIRSILEGSDSEDHSEAIRLLDEMIRVLYGV